jgi:aspartate aminotransferase
MIPKRRKNDWRGVMGLSRRAKAIKPSATLAITAKVKQMEKDGIDIVGFGAGEPDFDTPDYIKESAKKSLDAGFTKYTPASGIPELKNAICRKLKKDVNLDYEPSQVVVSCGAKHSIYNAIQVICDEGDEVILPSPFWVSYPEQIKLAGAKPVLIETSEKDGFRITAEKLSRAITPRTKLFILNSPSNPTGMVYHENELKAIAAVLVKKNIYCISDEIYGRMVYDGVKHISIASLGPEIKALTVVVDGLSKTYSMTGWRIGYAAGPKDVMTALADLQSHSTSNPVSFCQKAGVTALEGPEDTVLAMVAEFKKRRDYIAGRLNKIKGVTCILPEGAFYVFPNISGLFGKKHEGQEIKDSLTLVDLLLGKAKIAAVPGVEFGDDKYLRFSYATSMENIIKGMDRLEKFIGELE